MTSSLTVQVPFHGRFVALACGRAGGRLRGEWLTYITLSRRHSRQLKASRPSSWRARLLQHGDRRRGRNRRERAQLWLHRMPRARGSRRRRSGLFGPAMEDASLWHIVPKSWSAAAHT